MRRDPGKRYRVVEGHLRTENHPGIKGGRASPPDTTTPARIQKSVERQVAQYCQRPRGKRRVIGPDVKDRRIKVPKIFVDLGS